MNLADTFELALPPRAHVEPVGPAKAPALMSFEAFRALLSEQPDLKELQLQGAGEPLAHPRFFDMVAYAVSRKIDVVTCSNLLSISDARIEECVQSGLRRIDVAPGAAQPSDCDYLRTGSKLRRALRNVRRLAGRRTAARTLRPEIRVVLLLLRSELPHLPELVRLAREHGADAIAFQHLWHDLCPARRFVEAQSLLREDAERLEASFSSIRALCREHGMALELPRMRLCQRPWRTVHIGASGEALPCARANTVQRLNLGNMRRDGVVRVWNGDAYREFREQLASDVPPQLCRRCSEYQGTS